MSERNKQILTSYTQAALVEGDLDAIPRFIAPEYVHHAPPAPDIHGIDGMRGAVVAYRSAFSDLSIEIHDMVAEGDRVATRLTVQGTHSGEFMRFAPTGRRIRLDVIALDRFASDKIVEGWEHADLMGLREQLLA